MARYEHLTIYKEVYSLSVVLFSVISRFSRDYKFSLWNRILDNITELLENIVLINSININDRKNLFLEVEKQIIRVNLLLNISNDLKLFWKKTVYLNCIESLVKIKKLKRGWEK
jgi:hypothetical protein